MRVKITLACTECKQRNYDKMKNKKMIRTGLKCESIVDFVKTYCPQRNQVTGGDYYVRVKKKFSFLVA